jgi:hypothetical protein
VLTKAPPQDLIPNQINILFLLKILIPWSTVLEKLTVTQLLKKFTAFYGTRRFITVFTRSRHWSLS